MTTEDIKKQMNEIIAQDAVVEKIIIQLIEKGKMDMSLLKELSKLSSKLVYLYNSLLENT